MSLLLALILISAAAVGYITFIRNEKRGAKYRAYDNKIYGVSSTRLAGETESRRKAEYEMRNAQNALRLSYYYYLLLYFCFILSPLLHSCLCCVNARRVGHNF